MQRFLLVIFLFLYFLPGLICWWWGGSAVFNFSVASTNGKMPELSQLLPGMHRWHIKWGKVMALSNMIPPFPSVGSGGIPLVPASIFISDQWLGLPLKVSINRKASQQASNEQSTMPKFLCIFKKRTFPYGCFSLHPFSQWI